MTKEQKSVLITASLSSFINPFSATAVNVALPSIASELHMSAVAMSFATTIFLLSMGVALLPISKLSELKGKKNLLLLGSIIFTLGSILITMTNSVTFFLAMRILQGVGVASMFATGVVILLNTFHAKERGKVLGISVASVYTGTTLGPFLGGILSQYFGWRSIFYFSCIVTLPTIYLIVTKIHNFHNEKLNEKFDLIGSFAYASALTLLVYGFSHLPDSHGFALSIAGIILFIIFYNYEMRVRHPLFDFIIFKSNKIFLFSNLAALINYSTTYAISFLISLYLQYVKGFTPSQAGTILLCMPIIMAMLSPFAGKISDNKDPGLIASIGMFICAIGLLAFSQLNFESSIYLVVISLIITGLGFAFFSSPNSNAIMTSVDKKHYTQASSTMGIMRLLGQMMSMAVVMAITSLVIGEAKITKDNVYKFITVMHSAFYFFVVLSLVGVYLSLKRKRTSN